ncbi:MAG TPA: D-alanyl-D-alanine carboxypeptidase/D-alanyl-D-alanine-endopeptidase, partial [Vicinamibacteria bacterium]|nr:D-alanyl-D-alanine carboxypeptidase/D-alanyl-D-alanine-endopeptidase [Vicinamibacteria bacterium]
LSETIQTVNKRSQNLHAEMLLRLLGARVKRDGSAEGGLGAVQAFLSRIGVDLGGWDIEDGSGLSSHDLVTPHGLADLLAAMDRHPQGAIFRASLPIAGVDGSLRGRMKGTRAEGRVIAKTGSVEHVAALAGYVETKGGGRLAVVILVNHETAKGREASAAIDTICEILAGGGG